MAFSVEERYNLKIKIAHLYYLEDKTQVEISKMLNISRPTIIKLLKEAKDEKIVRIQIAELKNTNRFLKDEIRLRNLLDIEDAKVVNVPSENFDIICDRIGSATANYMNNLLRSGQRIGLGWGRTLEYFAEKVVTVNKIKDLEFVPLLGGFGTNKDIKMFANALCEKVASNFPKSTVQYLYAPMIATSELTAKAFLESKPIQNIFDLINNLDIAVIGIDGDINHSTTIENSIATDPDVLSSDDMKELRKYNAVGNVCARFYDINGNICNVSINKRVIAASAECLKHIPTVIAAAGGKYKIDSIIGAAKGKLFNVLITDEYTSNNILAKLKDQVSQ